MKIKVVKDAYYVIEDLTDCGLISKDEFENSYSHTLVKGDVWECDEEGFFRCIEGSMEGSEGAWWEYSDVMDYVEII